MRAIRRIASVASPVSLQKGFGLAEYTALYQNISEALRGHPEIAELYVSRDRTAALFAITPASTLAVKQVEQLSRDLETVSPAGPFSLQIGGDAAEHNDFNDYMFRSLPRIVGFVVGATLLMLFFAFRSYLLPVEAVLMNLLAVAAGIGAVVAVFQHGWFNGLIGLERPFSAIPLEVPMMVFCLSFGLSMDYELFLLFRIKREYAIDGDNDRATVAGLVSVAPVITGAGLIMAAVFGAFVSSAQLPVLKMMGVDSAWRGAGGRHGDSQLRRPGRGALGGRRNWATPAARGDDSGGPFQDMGLPQRASTPCRSRIAEKPPRTLQSVPCASWARCSYSTISLSSRNTILGEPWARTATPRLNDAGELGLLYRGDYPYVRLARCSASSGVYPSQTSSTGSSVSWMLRPTQTLRLWFG